MLTRSRSSREGKKRRSICNKQELEGKIDTKE